MTITFRQLEIFEKVAEGGHVTQASSRLYLTQSAVSMAIAEFERLARGPLFERQGRRLLLNDRGRKILPEVRDVLMKVRTIEQFLEESAGEPQGTLNVGASTTIGNYLLPAMVAEFSRQYSRAKVVLHVGNAQQIENALESGSLDIGLSEGIPRSTSLDSTPWKTDELVVVVGREHDWVSAKKASREMLKNAVWIMRETGSGTREIFESAMTKKEIDFSIALELGHTEAIKKASEAGLGVGCLSRMAVQRELENGWLVEIDSPLDLHRTLWILTRKSEYMTTLSKTFLAFLLSNSEPKKERVGASTSISPPTPH